MKIAIGNDHRGTELKDRVVLLLQQMRHVVVNVGTNDAESVDYPDFASLVCSQVSNGGVDRGILICGSGIGMNIAANKYKGIRAVRAQDEYDAEWCRRHNDVNVLCLSADRIGQGPVDRIIEIWLTTDFEGGRHARRINKIRALEEKKDG